MSAERVARWDLAHYPGVDAGAVARERVKAEKGTESPESLLDGSADYDLGNHPRDV